MPEELVPRFARIPAGRFVMGAADGDADERPAHGVDVDAFQIGVYPVTQDQYAEFVRAAGHRPPSISDLPLIVTRESEDAFRDLSAPYVWRGGEPPRGLGNHPVTLVTVDDALAYCGWLAKYLGHGIRLPTEAEWERAARGGVDGLRYPWGDDVDPSRANFLPDPGLKAHRGTEPVGRYEPNGFGVFDMCGNVWEWVADWYGPDVYRQQPRRNPRGPESGTLRIVRGGSWVTADVTQVTCAYRHKVPPDTYAYSIGFRVAYSDAPGSSA
jgi:formylglycine-generating enzyme required for sulfatase activity